MWQTTRGDRIWRPPRRYAGVAFPTQSIYSFDWCSDASALGVTDGLPALTAVLCLQPAVGSTLVDSIPVGQVPPRKVAVAVTQFACSAVSTSVETLPSSPQVSPSGRACGGSARAVQHACDERRPTPALPRTCTTVHAQLTPLRRRCGSAGQPPHLQRCQRRVYGDQTAASVPSVSRPAMLTPLTTTLPLC